MRVIVLKVMLVALLTFGSAWSMGSAAQEPGVCSGNAEACRDEGFAGCCEDSCQCDHTPTGSVCVCSCCPIISG
jgi:hypothetical protein